MRRALCAALFVASSIGIFLVPAGADPPNNPDKISLSYDFSDNNDPASASNGVFNIIVNVLPEHTPGVVRMVAVAPAGANVNNVVCRYQAVSQSNVECAFNFSASGTWAVHAQYASSRGSDVAATAATNIAVSN